MLVKTNVGTESSQGVYRGKKIWQKISFHEGNCFCMA